MQLNVDVHGDGDRFAVLLHGMTGSAESWWRVVPLLVARGYRVLAVDLPGHGLSPRDPSQTLPEAAAAVADTVAAHCGRVPDLAMGHSWGGLLLAAAVNEGLLAPKLSVYVDPPFRFRGGHDRDEVVADYERDKEARTYENLRATRPHYSEQDCVVEARAAERFDPATAASPAAGPAYWYSPEPGSIIVRADPSAYVDEEAAAEHARRGVHVRSIPGAAHSVWYSSFDEFVAALPEVFGASRKGDV